jgi:type IV pilus assembly protein PilE
MLRKVKSFTLVELIIVVIIVGILASLGFTQYSQVVEKSRLAEAKTRIGVMRQLAYEYYLNNGTLTGMVNADVDAGVSCSTGSFYAYYLWVGASGEEASLVAARCTSGGKAPNAQRGYNFRLKYYPSTGRQTWLCAYTDNSSSCFGLPVEG